MQKPARFQAAAAASIAAMSLLLAVGAGICCSGASGSAALEHPDVAKTPEVRRPTSAAIQPTPALPPATAPATKPALVSFEDKKEGVRFQYSNAWKPEADKEYVLKLVPVRSNSYPRTLTFDIPDLPPHFPGMIKLHLIENGYLDDLKKLHPGLRVDRSVNHPMDNSAKARDVDCSWTEHNQAVSQLGFLVMRGERVYILTATTDAPGVPAVRTDFDAMTASLTWLK